MAALERGRLGAQREANPHSASGSLRILEHEADGHALIEHRGGTLGQAEMQLADGGGVPARCWRTALWLRPRSAVSSATSIERLASGM